MAELFEYFLVATLDTDKSPPVPEITFQFPDKITEQVITKAIPAFCFPEADELQKSLDTLPKETHQETFSFVSTLSDGGKRYGYCRRFSFRDKTKKPICYCLLSFCSSFSLFSQILDIVEIKFAEGDRSVYQFLHSVLAQPFPDPGATVVAKTISFAKNEKGEDDFKPEVYRLTRSDNDYEYLEFVSYSPLFDKVDLDKIITIFECLLYERRIIICSKTLSTLSACADAIANLAYPLAWQYVFIPILPKAMLSFLGAPMPFLIGILSSYIPLIEKEPIEEEVLIIDIDENKFIRTPTTTDEIPPSLKTSLLKTLKKIVRSGTKGMEFSLLIAHAFLRFFAAIFEDYHKYIVAPEHEFNFERFARHKSSEIRRFLNEFQNVQMYSSFIQEREMMSRKGILDHCILLRISRTELKKKIDSNVAKHKSGQTAPVNSAISMPVVQGDSVGLAKVPSWTAVTGPSLNRLEELRKTKPPPSSSDRPSTIEGSLPVAKTEVVDISQGANASGSAAPESQQIKSKPPVPARPNRPTKPRAETVGLSKTDDHVASSGPSESKGALSGVKNWFTMRTSGKPKADTSVAATAQRKESPEAAPTPKVEPTEETKSPIAVTRRLHRRRSSSADLEPSKRPEGTSSAESSSVASSESPSGSPPASASPLLSQAHKIPLRESRLQRAAESLLHIDTMSSSSGADESHHDRRSRRLGRMFTSLLPEAIASGDFQDQPQKPGRLDDDLAVLLDNADIADAMLVSSSRAGRVSQQIFYAYKPLLVARVPEFAPLFAKAEEEAKQQSATPAPMAKLTSSLPRVLCPYSAHVLMCILRFAYTDRIALDNLTPEEDIELLQIRSKSLRRLKSACLKFIKQRRLIRGTLGDYLAKLVPLMTAAGAEKPTKHTRVLFDTCKIFFATKIQNCMRKFDQGILSNFSSQFLVDIMSLHVDKTMQQKINALYDTTVSKYDEENQLSDTLKSLHRSAAQNGDFILSVRDSKVTTGSNTPISVHLGLLAARCSYFAPLYAGKKQASSKDLLEPISVQVWKHLLQFLYTGDLSGITTDDSSLPANLMAGAEVLSMKTTEFMVALEQGLASALTPGSVMNYLAHATTDPQRRAAHRFIASNLPKILELKKLQELPAETLVAIMREFTLADTGSPR